MPSIDRYTKMLLTIIAGALVYIAAMLSGEPARAQQAGEVSMRPQPVVIVGWEALATPLPVAVQAPQPLPVTFSGSPGPAVPVTITGIRAGSEWDEIRARVQQPLTATPGRP